MNPSTRRGHLDIWGVGLSPGEVSLFKHAGVTGYTGQKAISFEAERAMLEEPRQEQGMTTDSERPRLGCEQMLHLCRVPPNQGPAFSLHKSTLKLTSQTKEKKQALGAFQSPCALLRKAFLGLAKSPCHDGFPRLLPPYACLMLCDMHARDFQEPSLFA